MRSSILLLPLCCTAAALAGCGNKGPLYLPPPQPKAPPAHHAPAPAHTAPASSADTAQPANGE